MRKFLFIVAILLVFLAICGRPQAQVPVTISPVAKQCFGDADNDPLVGGKLYTYAAGTSTPLATYTSSAGVSQNTNPIILDSSGCTPSALFLSANSYKFVLKTSAGVTLWTVDGVTSLNILSSNNTWTGTNTFTGAVTFSSTVALNGTTTAKNLNRIQFADTSVCTAANDSCFTNAIAALPTTGGLIYACGSYSFTASVTISKPVMIVGCGGPSATTAGTQVGAKISPASGTPTEMFNIVGAGTSSMVSGVSFRDVKFYGSYNTGQAAIRVNKALNIDTERVAFTNWQQCLDFDYFFRWNSLNDSFSQCGTGTATSTAGIRIENRTNPGTPDEQISMVNPLWEGDQSAFTNQGIGIYIGPGVNQVKLFGPKADYYNTGTAAPWMQLNNASHVYIENVIYSYGGAHPSTATAGVIVSGTGGSPTFDFQIRGGSMSFGASSYAVSFDYSQNTQVTGVTFTGPASSANALNYTANATAVQEASSNRLSTADLLANDLSANGLVGCNPAAGGLGTSYCKKIGTTNIYDTNNVSRLSVVAGSSNVANVPAAQSHSFQINAVTQFAVNPANVVTVVPLVPSVAGATTVGTAGLPFQSVNVGTAANVYSSVSSSATAARSNPLPDASGNLVVKSAASANHAVCWKTADTIGYCSDVVAAGGTCTCN